VHYNLEVSTVSRIYWKYQEMGDVSDKKCSGKPKKLNEMAVKELDKKISENLAHYMTFHIKP